MADVPVDQLRRVAVYEGFDGEKDPSLKFFWKALENFQANRDVSLVVVGKTQSSQRWNQKPFKSYETPIMTTTRTQLYLNREPASSSSHCLHIPRRKCGWKF